MDPAPPHRLDPSPFGDLFTHDRPAGRAHWNTPTFRHRFAFGDDEVFGLPPGSTLRFHFGTAQSDGSLPFTISPADVSISPIALEAGRGTLQYAIASPATGVMRSTADGRRIDFDAVVKATLVNGSSAQSFTYAIPFTTEATSALDASGTNREDVSGVRVVEGVWYSQIVGATTNRTEACPAPGVAVSSVLSGSFDQLP